MPRKKNTDSLGKINYKGKANRDSLSKLVRQNEFLNSLIDSISDIMFCKDTDGRYLGCNRAFAEHAGLSKDEIVGKTDFDIYPQEEAEFYRRNDRMVLEQNERRCNEEWISYPDGRRVLIETCKTPYYGPDDTLLGIIGVSRDITDRKMIEEKSQQMASTLQQMVAGRTHELVKANQALQQEINERIKSEEALRESEAKYRLLVDNSYDLIWTLNADGVFTYVSPSWVRMLGYEPSSMIGKAFHPIVHPDEVAVCENYLQEVIHTKERKPGPEYRVKHADGTWRWHAATGTPVFGSDGSFISLVGMSRDVTERKHAEEALKESQQQLSDIINFLPDATFVIDKNDKVIAWNRAMEEMTGVKKEKIIGQGDYAYAIPFYGERQPHLLDLFETSDKELESRYQYVQRKGNTLYVETSAPALYGGEGAYVWATGAPLFDVQGNRVGAIESIRDITDRKLAEEELVWKTAFLEAQVEATLDGILVVDSKGQKILANQHLLDIWKVPQHIRVDKDDASLLQYVMSITKYPEQYLEKIMYLYDHPNETSRDEIEFKDGMVLDRYSSPVLGKDGRYYGRIWIFRDITERKQAEVELKESQQKLSDIINFLPDATLVIDKEGRIIAWNKAMEEMTEVKSADIIGKGNYEYAVPFYGERRPMLIDLVLKPQEEIETKYVSTQRGGLVLEGEAYMPALRGGEVYLFGRASVLRDSRGNTIGAIESIRDITARRRAEEKYRGIFENAVMGIFQATTEGPIISANPAFARILGYESPEEVVDTVIDIAQLYVHPEQRSEMLQLLKVQDIVEEREINFFRKDGSRAWLVFNGRAARDGSGKIIYYEGAIQDITDRKLLEFQLLRTQKMEAIGTLAGGIAHDFNNILSAVIGYSEMALGESKVSDRLHRYHEQIYKAGKRARDLVKQILAYSRQSEEKPRPMRVCPVIKEVLKLIRASLPSTIQIRQNIHSDPDVVLAEPTQIHQIIMNLCTNASHAMREKKGELKVSLVPVEIKPRDALIILHGLNPGMYLNLTVSDTGHGIDPGIMDRVFDPFFTTKRPGEGTGMGLSVVHGIVKSYNGAITVESEVGKGTTFRIYLPLLMETKEEREGKTTEHISGGKERILFVDDEEPLVDLGKRMLTGLGYKVVGRTSSLEALELFRARPDRFDIVITDMTMPNMTGIELAKELMHIRPGIPAILCTGFSEAITLEKAKAMGIKEFIMKPLIQEQIAAAIRRAVN